MAAAARRCSPSTRAPARRATPGRCSTPTARSATRPPSSGISAPRVPRRSTSARTVPRLLRYDVLSRTFETVFDVTSLLGGGKYLWQMHSSDDDRVHSATVKDSSTYQDLGCLVYREDTRQHQFFTPRGDYDECQIDKSGRWLVIKENVDNNYNEDNRVIDIETGAGAGAVGSERRRRPLRHGLRLHRRRRRQVGREPIRRSRLAVRREHDLGVRPRRLRDAVAGTAPASATSRTATGRAVCRSSSSWRAAAMRARSTLVAHERDRLLSAGRVDAGAGRCAEHDRSERVRRRQRRLLQASEGEHRSDRRVLPLDVEHGRESRRRVPRAHAVSAAGRDRVGAGTDVADANNSDTNAPTPTSRANVPDTGSGLAVDLSHRARAVDVHRQRHGDGRQPGQDRRLRRLSGRQRGVVRAGERHRRRAVRRGGTGHAPLRRPWLWRCRNGPGRHHLRASPPERRGRSSREQHLPDRDRVRRWRHASR